MIRRKESEKATESQNNKTTHQDRRAAHLVDLTLEARAARRVLLDLRVHGWQLAVQLLKLPRQVQNTFGERAILVAQLCELGLCLRRDKSQYMNSMWDSFKHG
jgi:hypothetical protein